MTYLICEKCGKQYPLPEGQESFNYENCTCGGKLVYSTTPKNSTPLNQDMVFEERLKSTPQVEGIKWRGVFIGFAFLIISLIISVMIIFGENVPTKTADVSMDFLIYFSVLTIILTAVAGSISAYLSGSKRFLVGAINGGMVGVILGVIVGFAGGLVVFVSGTLIFGLISMAGGVMGIFPRKFFKINKKK